VHEGAGVDGHRGVCTDVVAAVVGGASVLQCVNVAVARRPEAAEVLLEVAVVGAEEVVDEQQQLERGNRGSCGLEGRCDAVREEGDCIRGVGDKEEDLVHVLVVVAAARAPLDGHLDADEERPVGDRGGLGGRHVVHDRPDCCRNLA
jgi:hypothetical protein